MNSDLALWITACIILFIVGLYGLLAHRDGLRMIIALELMVSSANAMFIGIGFLTTPIDAIAQTYAFYALAIGSVVIGLALAFLTELYRVKKTVDLGEEILLRW